MTALPWPDHLLSLQEWDALPEDTSHHLELVEGILVAAPRPAPQHQLAGANLAVELNRQLPAHLIAVPDVDVVIDATGPATVRAPDVVVTTRSRYDQNPPRFESVDILLAVEIMSPGTSKTDRVTKPAEYAEVGIPSYWLIDLAAPATLTAFLLVDGYYEIIADTADSITLSKPAPVVVDVGALTARR
jgi:Uma2 family endonuclease